MRTPKKPKSVLITHLFHFKLKWSLKIIMKFQYQYTMPYQYYFFLFYYGYRSDKIEHTETLSVSHIIHKRCFIKMMIYFFQAQSILQMKKNFAIMNINRIFKLKFLIIYFNKTMAINIRVNFYFIFKFY